MAFVSMFLIILFILIFIFFIIGCIIFLNIKLSLYIIQSIGLIKIFNSDNFKYSYLLWIPGFYQYFIGKYACKNKIAILYCIMSILKYFVFIAYLLYFKYSNIFLILNIYLFFYFILDMIVFNLFYKKLYKNYRIYTIITILTLGITKPICIIRYLSSINSNEKLCNNIY